MAGGPGLRRRIGAALDVFRHGYPAARIAPPQERKAAVLGWPALGDARPEWHLIDYAAYVEEGVNMNAVIYAAVRYKWQAVAAAPLRAYQGDRDHPEPLDADHPLSKLVERPNPYQDWRTLQGQADAFLNVSGNAYFWLDRGRRGKGLPQAVYCPRPDRVFVVPDRDAKDGRPGLLGYLYVPEGRPWGSGTPVLPQDMMHVKLFNPLDPLGGLGEGLSPLSAGAYSIDVDNQITKFLKLFFERGGVPPYWFTFDEPLDDPTFDRLREQIGEVYGGTGGWVKPGVLDRGGDVKRVAFTFQEMGFEVIDERNESRILGPLGVPPILIGTRLGLQRSTFCLPANTRISTLGGLKNIVDIEPGNVIWSFVGGALKPRAVRRVWKTGRKLVYQIRTKNRTLNATGNHPVLVRVPGSSLVLNDERHSGYEWRRVDELAPGDYVVQPKVYPDCGGDMLPGGKSATSEFLKFCGAIIGDGTVMPGAGAISMAIPPTDRCYDDYIDLARSLFTKSPSRGDIIVTECLACGAEIENTPSRIENGRGRFCSKPCTYVGFRIHQGQPTKIIRREVSGRQPVSPIIQPRSFTIRTVQDSEYLASLGLDGRAHTKRIPSWVFGLNRELRLAFLAGLVDTDGSIGKRGTLSFCFTNENLTHDVRHLLLSVGIQCSNVSRQLVSADKLPQPGLQPVYDCYRFTASSALMISEIPFSDPFYRERVNQNAHRYKADGWDAAKAGLSPDLGFYKIVSIESLDEMDVYDMEVDGGHSFIADGLVVHNSNYQEARRAFWEDTMVPELGLFEAEFRYYLQGEEGEFVAYDFSRVPALQKDVPKLTEAAYRLWSMGVPANDALETVGLSVPDVPGGDTSYLPISVMASGTQAQEEHTEEGAAEAEEDARKALGTLPPKKARAR